MDLLNDNNRQLSTLNPSVTCQQIERLKNHPLCSSYLDGLPNILQRQVFGDRAKVASAPELSTILNALGEKLKSRPESYANQPQTSMTVKGFKALTDAFSGWGKEKGSRLPS